MQGNDIGTELGKKVVVIMEPTIVSHDPRKLKLRQKLRLSPDWDRQAEEDWVINETMLSWMMWFPRTYSMHIVVWSFLPSELFERLMLPIDRIAGAYVVQWVNWVSEHEAYMALRNDPDIHTVFDADDDRVERLWQMRAQRVQIGMAP
jgi:hypothetical protein